MILPDIKCFEYKDRSKKHKTNLVYLTMTLERTTSLVEAWRLISVYFNRFMSAITKKYGNICAIRVWEAYKDGYPHIHVILVFEEHDEQPPFNYQGPTASKLSTKKPTTRDKMRNRERILNHLEITPPGACDDCISTSLDITPRQQVNQICNRLANQGLITRQHMKCPRCMILKLVNQIP